MDARWKPFWGLVFFLVATGFGLDQEEIQKLQFEAAFQGRCDHGSPCEQLCFELHDGMYECDCRDGFILRGDGYSCAEMNSTASTPSVEDLKLDLIYQKDAVMDALEFSFPNTSVSSLDSNEIPQTLTNSTTAASSERINYTTLGPRLEQKLTSDSSSILKSTLPISTARPCVLDCGPGGGCHVENDEEPAKCLCPLGRGGDVCEKNITNRSLYESCYPKWRPFRNLLEGVVEVAVDERRRFGNCSGAVSSPECALCSMLSIHIFFKCYAWGHA